jgi:hypothetical protein
MSLLEEIRERRAKKEAAKKMRTEWIRASMKYRAIINIDFTNQKENEYQRLIAALMQIGWQYLETSSLAFEGDLPNILVAMELISKQCQTAGTLSALTFHIQGSTNLDGKPYPQSKSYRHALNEIRQKQFPEPVTTNAA